MAKVGRVKIMSFIINQQRRAVNRGSDCLYSDSGEMKKYTYASLLALSREAEAPVGVGIDTVGIVSVESKAGYRHGNS